MSSIVVGETEPGDTDMLKVRDDDFLAKAGEPRVPKYTEIITGRAQFNLEESVVLKLRRALDQANSRVRVTAPFQKKTSRTQTLH